MDRCVRFLTLTIFVMVLFLLTPNVIYSQDQVVINEINAHQEWIELYRFNDTFDINFEGCVAYFQSSKSQKKSLTVNDNFAPGELYKVIYTDGSYLNNSSSDAVWIECPNFILSQVVYPDGIGTKSFARIPDGLGEFYFTNEITLAAENPLPSPQPTATSTSTATATATATAKPTPTQTSTPTPTKLPTSTAKPTETPINTEEVLGDEDVVEIDDSEFEFLSLSDETSSPNPKIAGSTTTNNTKVVAFLFVYIGVIVLGFGLYNLYRKYRYEYNDTNGD